MSSKNGYYYEFSDFRLDAENPTPRLNARLVPPQALEALTLPARSSAARSCWRRPAQAISWTKGGPRFAALKDSPRLRAILQKMNLASSPQLD